MIFSLFLTLLAGLTIFPLIDKNKGIPIALLGLMVLGTSLMVDGLSYISAQTPETGVYVLTAVSNIITQAVGRIMFWGSALWLVGFVFHSRDKLKPISRA